MTPIMLAVATDHANETIVKLLLARKPALDVKSKAGETAWMWAAKFQHPAILPAIQAASAGLEAPHLSPVSAERAGNKDPRVAAEKALALMQKTDSTFLKNGGVSAATRRTSRRSRPRSPAKRKSPSIRPAQWSSCAPPNSNMRLRRTACSSASIRPPASFPPSLFSPWDSTALLPTA